MLYLIMLEFIIILSFVFVSVTGVLFHYTHKWFKNGVILHMFSAVNESTWEHMKLAFSPMFIISFIQSMFLSQEYDNFWFAILTSILIGMFLIPFLYYPIKMLIGREVTWISISIYFIAISLAFTYEYYVLNNAITFLSEKLSLIFLLILPLVFLYFTFYPPHLFLFKDPVSKRYGDKKSHLR